ncbi:MAG: glycosyltransferase family 2 protein [Bacteroidia bacterium]|jgi:glycosyltransferase involved in cell wall biosynthesis
MPAVSVIVTTYNRKEQLRETIQSILDQTFQDFELIVVDNFSNYDFPALMESFKSEKLKCVQHQNQGIIAVNRNVGIDLAKGEFLAFCDDDDIWLPEKLERQLELLKKYKGESELCLTYCNTILFGEGVNSTQTNKKPVRNFDDFIPSNELSYSTVMLRNSGIVRFNEDRYLVACEDYNLWIELILNGYRFLLMPEALVKYRVTATSASAPSRELNSIRTLFTLSMNLLKYKDVKLSYFKLFLRFNKDLMKYMVIRYRNKN